MDSETSSIVVSTLANTVWHALDQNLLTTALFTAERLYHEDRNNADIIHLVALTHYRAGEYHKAAEIYTISVLGDQLPNSKPSSGLFNLPASISSSSSSTINTEIATHPGCVYIYALSCLALGEYSKGILALERSSAAWENLETKNVANASPASNSRLIIPTAAMIHTVLGHLYRAVDSDSKAIKSYAMASRLDPLLWEATEALCHYGIDLKVDNLYKHMSVESLPGAIPLSDTKYTSPPAPPPHFFIDSNSSAESFNQRLHSTTPIASSGGLKGGILRPRSRAGIGSSGPPSPGKSIFGRPLSSSVDTDNNNDGMNSISTSTPDPKRSSALNSQLKRTTRHMPTHGPSFNGPINSGVSTPLFATDLKRSTRPTDTKKVPGSSNSLFPGQSNTSLFNSSRVPPVTIVQNKNGLFSKFPKPASSSSNEMVDNNNDPTLQQQSSLPIISAEYYQALQYLVSLYTHLTRAFLQLSRYECDPALKTLNKLPSINQQESPFCLSLYARLHFEKVDYVKSLQFFEHLKRVDRFRVKDMDIYSTLLWHLRKDYELSYLASDLSNYARNRAQTWCAIGNACSLQHENEAALRCFRRASQIEQIGAGNVSPGGSGNAANSEGNGDSKNRGAGGNGVGGTLGYSGSTGIGFVGGTAGAGGVDGTGSSGGFGTSSCVTIGSNVGNGCGGSRGYAYAYTLQAHEYVANDAYEHAQDTYRLAIRADKRHYNAWYGLGMVFLRLGDTKMAELHFRKASQINPANVVLMCCVGMVLEKTGRLEEALQQYNRAIQLQEQQQQQEPEDEDLEMNLDDGTNTESGGLFYNDEDNFEDEENEFEDGTSYQDEDSLMAHHPHGAKLKLKGIRSKSQMYQKSAGLNGMKPMSMKSTSVKNGKNQRDMAGIYSLLYSKKNSDSNSHRNPGAGGNKNVDKNSTSTTTRIRQGSAMARYKRARLLFKMQRYHMALEELEILSLLASNEACVHFLLGQVYQILGHREKAVKSFTVAWNLDPKGSQMIDDALQSLGASSGKGNGNGNNSGGGHGGGNAAATPGAAVGVGS